ncbi:MAG: hypothetical protein LIO91_05190 [Bacteroidales bacterium]|nr:hypothetical protein [Bacteroidales bacterium]
MKNRKNRLPAIVEILSKHVISSQEELSKQLAKEGFVVTQATLSRDLKTLRTTKIPTDLGGYRYVVPDHDKREQAPRSARAVLQTALHPATISVAISGNIVVIKTRNGYASGLAYDIDMLDSPHILGTIPGADTVMAVINEHSTRPEIYSLLCTILPQEVMTAAKKGFGV